MLAILAWMLASSASAVDPAPAGTTTLLYASPYAPSHPFSRADQAWMRWVEEHSGGSLKIRPLWSGALLSSDQSLEELRHGVADIGLITPIYIRGGVHLIRIQSGFYEGARTFEQQVSVYRCLAQDFPEYARELRGLRVLAVQGGALPGVVTRTRAVHGLEDLRGLRLRAPTELLGLLRDLGADAVNMPMGDVYSALAKGVIDGVVAPADTLRSLHFSEVARFYARLEVPRGAYPARAMNMKRWEQLTAAQRRVLEDSGAVWEAALAHETRAAVGAGEAQGLRDGVTFTDVSDADQHRFSALYVDDATRNARALGAYGIDGPAILARARALIQGLGSRDLADCSATGGPVAP